MKVNELELLVKKKDDLTQKIAFGFFVSFVFVLIMAVAFAISSILAGFLIIIGANDAVSGKFSVLLMTLVSSVLVCGSYFRIDYFNLSLRIGDFFVNRKTKKYKISMPSRYKWFKLSGAFFSVKSQKEVFLPIMADWDQEVFAST